MQAVILVGGEGTRLRPLTSNVPKPVVALVDRPMMAYMFEWLHGHGVDDVIMSCGFKATKVRDVLGDGRRYGIRLRFVEEPDPRGTAGALKFAEDLLEERFLMLNGDVLTDLDLTAQIAPARGDRRDRHARARAGPGPSSYGLVRLCEDGSVEEFLEKPSPDAVLDTNLISAGAYVLERSVLDMIAPDSNVSIEREVWPALVDQGLYGYVDDTAYWIDVGTPGALPAGDLRHPRGQCPHAGRGQARRRLPLDRSVGARRRGAPSRRRSSAPGGDDRRGRPRRQPRRPRPRRQHRRRLDRRARGRPRRRAVGDRLHPARLHRRPGRRGRRPQPGHRWRDGGRGRQDRRRQRHRARCAAVPRDGGT